MQNKVLRAELRLSPELDPCKVIINLSREFNFRKIVLDDIDRTEDSGGLRARINNLASGIDAETSLEECSSPEGYAEMLCRYSGPVVDFLNGRRQIVKAELSAYVMQSIHKGHIVKRVERQGDAPSWWLFRDE